MGTRTESQFHHETCSSSSSSSAPNTFIHSLSPSIQLNTRDCVENYDGKEQLVHLAASLLTLPDFPFLVTQTFFAFFLLLLRAHPQPTNHLGISYQKRIPSKM